MKNTNDDAGGDVGSTDWLGDWREREADKSGRVCRAMAMTSVGCACVTGSTVWQGAVGWTLSIAGVVLTSCSVITVWRNWPTAPPKSPSDPAHLPPT